MLKDTVSIVINCDTRPMMDAEMFTVGDDGGQGSLHGCRSWDFLLAGIEQKLDFFRTVPKQLIIYVDLHEPIPDDVMSFLKWCEYSVPDSKLVIKEHERTFPHWNDRILLDALKLADGEFVAHFDQDANAMSNPSFDAGKKIIAALELGVAKFICQPTDLTREQHGMWWASTRFFACRRAALDFEALEDAMADPQRIFSKYPSFGQTHLPCLEHILGITAGKDGVLYPPRQDDNWLAWSWARYRKGLLVRLNEMDWESVSRYISKDLGLCGPNDCLAKSELP